MCSSRKWAKIPTTVHNFFVCQKSVCTFFFPLIFFFYEIQYFVEKALFCHGWSTLIKFGQDINITVYSSILCLPKNMLICCSHNSSLKHITQFPMRNRLRQWKLECRLYGIMLRTIVSRTWKAPALDRYQQMLFSEAARYRETFRL